MPFGEIVAKRRFIEHQNKLLTWWDKQWQSKQW